MLGWGRGDARTRALYFATERPASAASPAKKATGFHMSFFCGVADEAEAEAVWPALLLPALVAGMELVAVALVTTHMFFLGVYLAEEAEVEAVLASPSPSSSLSLAIFIAAVLVATSSDLDRKT